MLLSACAFCVLGGCSSLQVNSPPAAYPLDEREAAFARALAHYAQGLILEGERGRGCEAALEHYLLAEEHDKGNPKLAARIAFASLRGRDVDLAIEALERACRKHPGSAAIHLELGTVYRFADRVDESVAHYLEAIRIDPTAGFPYQAMASIHFARENDGEALELLRQGCDRADDTDRLLEFCRRQGTHFLSEGEGARAIPCFVLIAEKEVSVRREIYNLLGELHSALARKTEALRYYRLATQQDNPLAEAYVSMAKLQREGDVEAAIGTLKEAITHFPDKPMFHVLLGDAFDAKGAGDDARQQYEQACKMQPPLPDAFVRLAVADLADGTEKALATLERGRKRLPDAVPILFVMASIQTAEKRYEEAMGLFERIRRIAGASTTSRPASRFYLQYAATCEAAGLAEKAESVLREGLEEYPDEQLILNYLAYMWAEQGNNLDEALTYSLKTLKGNPDNAAYADTLGWIYFKLEKYELALESLKRANELQAGDSTLLDHLGDVYSALGQTDKALTYWKQSFSIDPKNQDLETKLRAQGVDTSALRRTRD